MLRVADGTSKRLVSVLLYLLLGMLSSDKTSLFEWNFSEGILFLFYEENIKIHSLHFFTNWITIITEKWEGKEETETRNTLFVSLIMIINKLDFVFSKF